MASSTKNVRLGACRVYYDGVDLGLTKGGVELEVTTTTHDVTVDQFGETPISSLITGRTITVNVPMAETTLENLVQVMPGAELVTNGVRSTGTITFTGETLEGETVKIGDTTFTFKNAPALLTDVPVADDKIDAAEMFAAVANDAGTPYRFEVAGAVVTVTSKFTGGFYDAVVTSTSTEATVASLTGGRDATSARVEVSSGVNINLLDIARPLLLRPVGTTGAEDVRIHRAGTPGALQFAYQTDSERIFQASFNGFATEDGRLFDLGDQTALAS